ncbi:hypothetical protein FHW77_005444 [Agrobacterium sp. RC10-4-1]|uniref:hypothetical protein n=1 Tax=Agrobacterium sp. RC10-4-1 TaxID=2587039 RepID=UPI000DD0732F|nr:hypothetical protein [Agrobacterium sp. RC10-4-1]MBA8801687.1 hypothetical protein [Agrobacterium sp. RC10-4-1]
MLPIAAVVARAEVSSDDISILGRLYDLKGEITREANIDVGLGSENTVRRYKRNWRATPGEDDNYVYAIALL